MSINEAVSGSDGQYLSLNYQVIPDKLSSLGRSFEVLLLHRRCATCWGELINQPLKGIDIKADKHLQKIKSHCMESPDFMHSELPVMEAVFRVILGNGNKPITLASIHAGLLSKWADAGNPRTPSPVKLYSMIKRDVFYGIGEV